MLGFFQNLAIYVSERDIFYFEEADSCYSVETFLLQYTLLELPFEVLPSIVFSLFAAFVCGLERTVKVFLICAVNCTLILKCGESIDIMISTVFSHIGFAVNVVSIMLSISTVMGGIMSLKVNSVLERYCPPEPYCRSRRQKHILLTVPLTSGQSYFKKMTFQPPHPIGPHHHP